MEADMAMPRPDKTSTLIDMCRGLDSLSME